MAIHINHQLREQISYDASSFPISFFYNELVLLPNNEGPIHWHPEFEIATAECGTLDFFPKLESTRMQMNTQVRIQKMLSYIYEHYKETITLEDIAKAADISRSEAGRCFKRYMNCSPMDALIQYRLQVSHRLLSDTTLSLEEISDLCGFHSANYFSRRFRKEYGYAPSQYGRVGK